MSIRDSCQARYTQKFEKNLSLIFMNCLSPSTFHSLLAVVCCSSAVVVAVVSHQSRSLPSLLAPRSALRLPPNEELDSKNYVRAKSWTKLQYKEGCRTLASCIWFLLVLYCIQYYAIDQCSGMFLNSDTVATDDYFLYRQQQEARALSHTREASYQQEVQYVHNSSRTVRSNTLYVISKQKKYLLLLLDIIHYSSQ